MYKKRPFYIKKYTVFILFCILFVTVLLSNCTKKISNPPITEIEFWTLQLSGFSGYINSVIREYENLHPGIKIKWIDVPFSEGEKRALAAVLSNNVPDLINMNPDFGATLASKGALTNIKNFINKDEYDNYLSISWQASSIDDFVFGIPWYITSAVTFYNTKILTNAGIRQDEIPKTYSELGEIAYKIKEKTDKYVLMPTLTEDGNMLKFFNKYAVPIVDKTHHKAIFNTKQAIKVLSFWKNLYEKGFIPTESITQGHREALSKFQAGETAFIVAGPNFLKIIKQNSPQIYAKLRVSKQLTGSEHKTDFSLMNLVIPVRSKHPREAARFALFLTNKKNQLKFCKLATILPSEKHALMSKFFIEGNNDDLMVKSRLISAKQLTNSLQPIPPMKNRKDLYEIIDFMTQAVLLGQKAPEEALNSAVLEWNKNLKEN